MATNVRVKLNQKLFLKDPQDTELGRKIINVSIRLIDEKGFEHFTFKKLAQEIHSTEASIYRYFENKHKLLIYLTNWYWVWVDYQINFQTNNITSPREQLKIVIKILCETQNDQTETEVDEAALHRIIISESSKAYLNKEVDIANNEGLYLEYNKLCEKIADIIITVNPDYKYSKSLVSTLIETSRKQVYFAQHMPSLTDFKVNNDDYSKLKEYLEHLLFRAIE